jgi:hypothetical protein
MPQGICACDRFVVSYASDEGENSLNFSLLKAEKGSLMTARSANQFDKLAFALHRAEFG